MDSGVYEGGEISMFYDPMIAKVTTWGRDRDDAIALMRRALDEFYIKGVHHNIALLTALMANPRSSRVASARRSSPRSTRDGFVAGAARFGRSRQRSRRRDPDHLRYMYRAKNVEWTDAGLRPQDRPG